MVVSWSPVRDSSRPVASRHTTGPPRVVRLRDSSMTRTSLFTG
jgi:hypothetical protein